MPRNVFSIVFIALLMIMALTSGLISAVPSIYADAGPDQTVSRGTTVTFDGSGSFSGITSYDWTFFDEDPVVLHGVSPTYQFNNTGTFLVTLQVDNGMSSDTDTMMVTVTGNEYIVDINGSGDFTSIQEAIDFSSDGDTIFVYDGVYQEGLIINKSINLVGNGSASTFTNGSNFDASITVEADDVNISGFEINGIENSFNSMGIVISQCDNIRLDDIIVKQSIVGIMGQFSSNISIINFTAEGNFFGIAMGMGENLSVSDSEVLESFVAIYIFEFSDVDVINNSISKSEMGLYFEETINVNLSGNMINNITDAIVISGSNSSIIENNTISNSEIGIILDYSENMTLTNNTLALCGIELYGSGLSTLNTHSIDQTNLVNGKPVLYLKDQTGMTIDENHGQIILVNCSDMVVRNQTINNVSVGLFLAYSEDVLLMNNTVMGCYQGVSVRASQNIDIVDYNVSSSTYGIDLFNVSNVDLMNSNFSDCDSGVLIYVGTNVNMSGNSFRNCSDGIIIEDSWSFIIENNSISDSESGIKLDYAENMTLANNTMILCGITIYGDDVDYWNTHTILPNNLVNGKPVLYLKDQNGMTVEENYGQVILANCSDIEVRNQTINNATIGMALGYSEDVLLTNNTVWGCFQGAYIINSRDISISDSNFSENEDYGIYIGRTNNVDIQNITVTNNYNGVYFYYSNNNSVVSSNFIANNNSGMTFSHSHNSFISQSNFSHSIVNGLVLSYLSINNTIDENSFYSNGENGIYIFSLSNENVISGNNISHNALGLMISNSNNNSVYHNNFIDNEIQSTDNTVNNWNLSYPGGGNYWGDHTGADYFYGPDQDQWSSDGYIDVRYDVTGNVSSDMYPLLQPWFLDVVNPTSAAGIDQNVNPGEVVTFNASGSSDNVGITNYTWTFFNGTANVTLYGVAPQYAFHNAGVFIVTLNVTDAQGNWDVDELVITVNYMVNIGPITDKDGNPLVGVNVTILYGGQEYYGISDENGNVSIAFLPAEDVSTALVTITMDNYVSSSFTLDLEGEQIIDQIVMENNDFPYLVIIAIVLVFLLGMIVVKVGMKP